MLHAGFGTDTCLNKLLWSVSFPASVSLQNDVSDLLWIYVDKR